MPRVRRSADVARNCILEAAGELFYRQGFHGVGVDDIAQAAHMHKMSIYRLFGSKEGLAFAYISTLRCEADVIWERLIATYPNQPNEAIRAFFFAIFEKSKSPSYSGDALLKLSSEFKDETSEIAQCLRSQRSTLMARLMDVATSFAGERALALADALYVIWLGAVSPGRTCEEMIRDASRASSLVNILLESYV